MEEHAREKELVSMRVLPHATALTRKDVGDSNMHGLSERPFDKRRRCPENVARLAQHGSGVVGIKAGESVPQLSAPEPRWFVGRGWCRACGCKLSRLAADDFRRISRKMASESLPASK